MVRESNAKKTSFPIVPLRDLVVFPKMMIPIIAGRDKSIQAIDLAMSKDRRVIVVAQKDLSVESPNVKDLNQVGTISEILQILKLPDGTVKLLLEGKERVVLSKVQDMGGYFVATALEFVEKPLDGRFSQAMVRAALALFEEYVKYNPRVSPELVAGVSASSDPSSASDMISANLTIRLQEKQELLSEFDLKVRFEKILEILSRENDILKLEHKITNDVRGKIEKNQRDLYLHEQLRTIQKELGAGDPFADEVEGLRKSIIKSQMPENIQGICLKELLKLQKMHPVTPEATVSRNYLEWMISLPWKREPSKFSNVDLTNAIDLLEKGHYGLEKVKERILEYISVCCKTGGIKGQVLCFIGPPGVGKTSLARSIASALNRKFVRVSLGGVRDEAEIKGHRRTYIGALPGRIIQGIKKAGSTKPVFLLDEIDKMTSDFKGDPSSALLEVLDRGENKYFSDHYLEVEYDLSDVLFITTANVEENIPHVLRDRLEIIRFSGYTEIEKFEIASRHILPAQIKEHGLTNAEIEISKDAIFDIIRYYTKEAGVRQLERQIASICRKAVREIVQTNNSTVVKFDSENLSKYLGQKEYTLNRKQIAPQSGVATGMCWTPFGGDILSFEVNVMNGKGELSLTGLLGDVMKESAKAALGFIRANAARYGLDNLVFKDLDIHVHVPEGAISKDGPSAGVTMAVAILSALTKKPVRNDLAMTGEITLTGKVLGVGGIKEKVLAAAREQIKDVILPDYNKKDLDQLPKEIRDYTNFIFVGDIDSVFEIAFVKDEDLRRQTKNNICSAIPTVKNSSISNVRGQL